jgi:hypothetical protein
MNNLLNKINMSKKGHQSKKLLRSIPSWVGVLLFAAGLVIDYFVGVSWNLI